LKLLQTDVVIIGAGPVGLFTAFQAGMLGFSSAVTDVLGFIGGQCSALYPQKPIYDIPGFPKINGLELIDNLAAQASPFKPEYILGHQVQKIERQDDFWLVQTAEPRTIKAKAVVIAAGVGAFVHNTPPLEGIKAFEETSVLYSITDIEKFRNKRVLIAGGGDSALDWAVALADVASMIYVVHRRDKFRAAPETTRQMEDLVQRGKIKLLVPYQLYGLQGKGAHLSKVQVQHMDGNIEDVAVDFMLPFFGMAMKLGPIAEWGLQLDRDRIVVDPATMQTNLPGVFAIGDIATYPGKLKLILTGFAEAALACHSAYDVINPGKPLHFEYSTTKGISASENDAGKNN